MRKIENKTRDGDIFCFDSVAEIMEFSDADLYKYSDPSFIGESGLNQWDGVEERVDADWQIGMEALEEYVKRLKDVELPELKSHKRKTQFHEDEGDEIDYDKLMQGQPYWRQSEREESEGEISVTIVIDTSTPAMYDSMDILWRGAAAIALAIILEERGYRCEIWCINGSYLYANRRRKVMSSCCLKKGSDTLDSSTLINTVAGWFYRTVIFTQDKTIARKEGEEVAIGLGPAYSPTAIDLDCITPDENRIYSSGVFTFSGAYNMLVAELNKFSHVKE